MSSPSSSAQRIRNVLATTVLPDLLSEENIPVVRSGSSYFANCWIHEDRSPSNQLIDPNRSQTGAWRYLCYGCGAKGDAIDIVSSRHNLKFWEAVEFLEQRAGYHGRSPSITAPLVRPGSEIAVHHLPVVQQITTMTEFVGLLEDLPHARSRADAYLQKRLGHHADLPANAGCWVVTRSDLDSLAQRVSENPLQRDQWLAAGLAKDRSGRFALQWWDDTLIGVSCRRDGAPMFAWGRRLDTTYLPDRRYINQSSGGGARHVPFGLDALAQAAGTHGTLRIVEGPITALGSRVLASRAAPTMAMLTRIGWGGTPSPVGQPSQPSASQRELWDRLVPDLQRCATVEITPDNEGDHRRTVSTATGEILLERHRGYRMAEHLAVYLRERDVPALVTPLAEDPSYQPTAPAAWGSALGYPDKDLADAAVAARR